MNKRVLYALPATLLAILALALSVMGFMSAKNEAPAPNPTLAESQAKAPEAPRYQYLMATRPLSPGEPVVEDAFTTISSDKPVAEALPAATPPYGVVVETGLDAGQILTAAHLRSDSVLARLVAPGFQAMAIAVDDVSGVGGLLRPGDRVNVTASFRRSDKQNEPAALRLLENVLVVAVKGVPYQGEAGEDNDQRRNSTVVLSVPEDLVSALLLASNEGNLRLVAVAPEQKAGEGDESAGRDRQTVSAVYLDDLFPAPPPPPPRSTVSRPSTRVQVFEGVESRNVYVR